MTDKEEKLKLESALNQIYNNDNLHNGSFINFIFCNVNYIYLNDVYLYPRESVEIVINTDSMTFNIDSTLIEVMYCDIDDFLINVKEGNDV